MEIPMHNAAVQHARLDAAMTRAIEALYPIDPQTGLSLYKAFARPTSTNSWRSLMNKRIQIVARIEPDLRRTVARVVKRQKTTLNALVEAALRAYVEGVGPISLPKVSQKAAE
jgi:hypothetical protein